MPRFIEGELTIGIRIEISDWVDLDKADPKTFLMELVRDARVIPSIFGVAIPSYRIDNVEVMDSEGF
jgi:hypothetical protein